MSQTYLFLRTFLVDAGAVGCSSIGNEPADVSDGYENASFPWKVGRMPDSNFCSHGPFLNPYIWIICTLEFSKELATEQFLLNVVL